MNNTQVETATQTTDTPQVLLEHHLKELRLPTILRETGVPGDRSSSLGWEYDRVARQCAVEQVNYPRYLLRITELELLDRERRATDRRIRQAGVPTDRSTSVGWKDRGPHKQVQVRGVAGGHCAICQATALANIGRAVCGPG
jgi:hypothetical protein